MSFSLGKYGVRTLIALAGAFMLSGCVTTGTSSTSSQTATARTLLAALDGGLVSRIDGLNLRNADQTRALEAEYRALEYTAPSQPVYWQSANEAVSGTVVSSQPYRVGTQDCRQYTVLVTSQNTTNEERGTACRNPDGSWSLLS